MKVWVHHLAIVTRLAVRMEPVGTPISRMVILALVLLLYSFSASTTSTSVSTLKYYETYGNMCIGGSLQGLVGQSDGISILNFGTFCIAFRGISPT